MCGLYDTFIDGKKKVQLKNFDNSLLVYNVGDKVPMKRCDYPPSGLFICKVNPTGFVLVEKGIFKGIIEDSLKIIRQKFPKMKIWDCQGNEYEGR